MNPLQALQADATTYLAVPGGMVYRLRRVRTADLVQVGHAELVGQTEVRKALKNIQADMRRGKPDEDLSEKERKKLERNARHDAEKAAERFTEVISKSPERAKAWLDRTDAYVCAGVTGLAWLTSEYQVVAEPTDEDVNGHTVVPPFSEVTVDQIRDLTEARFVRAQSDVDHKATPPRVWVGDIQQVHRQILHGIVMKMNGVEAASRPFRGQPGHGAGGVSGGE